jgi:hypothetical protein
MIASLFSAAMIDMSMPPIVIPPVRDDRSGVADPGKSAGRSPVGDDPR